MDRLDALLHETLSDLPVATDGLDETMRRVRSRRRRRAWLRATSAAALAVAVAAVGINGLSGSTPPASAITVQLPGKIVAATGTPGRVWALTCTERCSDVKRSLGQLMTIDARTGRARATATVRSPQAVTTGENSVWTADFWDGTVTRFSAATGRPLATIPLQLPRPVAGHDDRFLPTDLTVGDGAVWVSTGRGYVARIDPTTNRVAAMIKTADDSTGPMAAGAGAVWIGEGLELGRLDPGTESLSHKTVDGPDGRRLSIGALALTDGALWIAGQWATRSRDATGHLDYTVTDEAVLVELDPATGIVRSVNSMPRGTTLRSYGASTLWLANVRTKHVYAFSPKARAIVASVRTPATGAVIPASGQRRVWVARSTREFTRVNLVDRHSH